MFIHSVYFWMKPELPDPALKRFIEGLHSLLTIKTVHAGHIAFPAETRRPVVDHTYSHALMLMFPDASAHEQYQLDPIHDRFRHECGAYWNKVVIYDCMSGDRKL